MEMTEKMECKVSSEDSRPTQMSGWRRWCYLILGWCFVVLAILGAILPVLPCTPFVLAASYYFVRSSPRRHQWLRQSRLFGPLLRDWEDRRGVRRQVKFLAVSLLVVVLSSTIYLGAFSWPLVILVVGLGLIGVVVVLRLPVVEENPLLQDSLPPGRQEPALGEAET